jgi:peptidoglycan/LPS O-acetylase OafA/YrhL
MTGDSSVPVVGTREDAEVAPRGTAGPPIHALTGLRFLAALLVLFSHFPEIIPFHGAALPLVRQGAAGVTVFFVLSGFLLTYNYFYAFVDTTAGAASFLRARVARIYPMHVVALLVVTPAVLLLTDSTPSVASWFVNLSMLHALIPAKSMHLWNIPSWSVSGELIFYCCFPFFIWSVLSRVRRPGGLVRLVATLFIVETVLFCAVAVFTERHFQQSKTPEDITAILERVKFFPGLRIWEFLLGCVVGRIFLYATAHPHGWWNVFDRRRVRNGLLLLVALAAFGILLLPSLVDIPSTGLFAQVATAGLYVVYTPLAVVLVAVVAWGPTTVTPILEHRWTRTLGNASYSVYLLQWTVVLVVAEASWAPNPRTWMFSAAAIAVLIGASILSARWIEAPAREFIRGRPVRPPRIE